MLIILYEMTIAGGIAFGVGCLVFTLVPLGILWKESKARQMTENN